MCSLLISQFFYMRTKNANKTNFSYTTWFRIVKHAKINNQYVYLIFDNTGFFNWNYKFVELNELPFISTKNVAKFFKKKNYSILFKLEKRNFHIFCVILFCTCWFVCNISCVSSLFPFIFFFLFCFAALDLIYNT